jgi:hypothetical protein
MSRPLKFLLLKMDHIGDALWSFPAIRALRAGIRTPPSICCARRISPKPFVRYPNYPK